MVHCGPTNAEEKGEPSSPLPSSRNPIVGGVPLQTPVSPSVAFNLSSPNLSLSSSLNLPLSRTAFSPPISHFSLSSKLTHGQARSATPVGKRRHAHSKMIQRGLKRHGPARQQPRRERLAGGWRVRMAEERRP